VKQIRMPTGFRRYSRIAGLMIAVGLACQSLPAAKAENNSGLGPDILYVGDADDSTIKSFDADGHLITQSSGGDLNGPNALLIAGPELIVVNQNFGGANGEILQYQLKHLSFTGPWLSKSDPDAPFAPRGAALKNGVLYVADFVKDGVLGTPGIVPLVMV
jgi:hypothetical protein